MSYLFLSILNLFDMVDSFSSDLQVFYDSSGIAHNETVRHASEERVATLSQV